MSAAPRLPRVMPIFRPIVPKWVQPWVCLLCAFAFQLSGVVYGGVVSHFMGATCLMREDATMITLCGVVGSCVPFPMLFRLKFRFTSRQLIVTAAVIVGACNICATLTQWVPLLCLLSFVAGFFKLCGTFENMSNIQLWITHKRDFTIFFPVLFSIIVGCMSLSPWLSLQLSYVSQDWRLMNWLVAGVMFGFALLYFIITRDFRFMKPMPFLGIDYIGMTLWTAVMLEIIFLFNYGEFYNWWNGAPFRTMAILMPVTLYLAIERMRHIRHPYISPAAWLHKRLLPLLALFALMELVNSTPKVLQNAFVGSTLHYGIMQTSELYMAELFGTVCGMSFIVFWVKVMHLKYTRLLTIGTAAMLVYTLWLYLLVEPGIPIESLYAPVWWRAFGIAIFFAVLTIYLNDLMPFDQFFMGLMMAGMVRNGVVQTVCSGIYSYHLRHHIADNLSRGLPYDTPQALLLSVKQLYGFTSIVALVVLMAFLLWNIQPVRSTMRKIPYWNVVGRIMRRKNARGASQHGDLDAEG